MRHLPCPEESEVSRGYSSHSDLSFRSDVPESHLEAWRDCQCTAKKRYRDPYRLLQIDRSGDRTLDYDAISLYWIIACKHHRNTAEYKRDYYRADSDCPDFPGRHLRALRKPDKRSPVLCAAHSAPFALNCVIIRPISSFVAVRASTHPATCPPQRTRILSASSIRTSRSSPT